MNPYRIARLKSVKYLDTAAYYLGISEEALRRIESDGIPSSKLVEKMARLYQCPELVNEHKEKPIGMSELKLIQPKAEVA